MGDKKPLAMAKDGEVQTLADGAGTKVTGTVLKMLSRLTPV